MSFGWLKYSLPRSLYGRAALILIAPIVVLLLVVSVNFLQRYFEDVTRQMVRSVALEINYILDEVAQSPDLSAAERRARAIARPLALEVAFSAPDAPAGDLRTFIDISGITLIGTLRDRVEGVNWVDLSNSRKVRVGIATGFGEMQMTFDRRRVTASNPHQLLVLMVFTAVLMTLIAVVFLRNQLRPIKRLARAAEAFGKGRRINYVPTGAIEVRAAGNAFLDMRARLERQIEQRTMMLSGVSHDLRTPLTRMRLELSMFDGPEAEALRRDVAEMEKLLDTFLDFARSEALDDLDTVDPAELAREVVERAAGAGQPVAWGGHTGGAKVALRPLAVERALGNLIGNAVRYARNCRVSVVITERAVVFSVEDDGPGIPVTLREEALKPFARLEPGRNQNRGSGVGLGLAIAIDIARQHGGTLRLTESLDLGGLRADLVLAR